MNDKAQVVNPASVEKDSQPAPETKPEFRSLKDLLDRVTGRDRPAPEFVEESGIAEALPFPFLAIVGQREMKLALLLALINPSIGGVLLIGPRGTGKTTTVRSLVDLLPLAPKSLCYYGCMPEDIEIGGMDAVCLDCAKKYAEGQSLVKLDKVRLVELPLNARLDDVVGGLDERASIHDRVRLKRGLLAQADRNLLYVDEINLLSNDVVDALLDASSQGSYTVRRGPMSATYWSRMVLIGSMNPEEGRLRPQIQDRFGLRVVVHGLDDASDRLEAYRRVHAYFSDRRRTIAEYEEETDFARSEIQTARDLVQQVILPDDVAQKGLEIIHKLTIDSLRAEITLFEAARAHAAADARQSVTIYDICQVALIALRLRRSGFIANYFDQQRTEDEEILNIQDSVLPGPGNQ